MFGLMLMTGCPSEFGKQGRVNRAVHQDALELIQRNCTQEAAEEFCGGDMEDSEECRKQCGG